MRHPCLSPLRLVEAGPGRLALISGAGDSSLAARLKECLDAGLPGIPREGLLPSLARVARARPDVIIRHPGPMNRGVEIASEVADGPFSVILEQVANGVAVRMAVLYLLAGGAED